MSSIDVDGPGRLGARAVSTRTLAGSERAHRESTQPLHVGEQRGIVAALAPAAMAFTPADD
jgi:hypothetical protein